MNIKLSEEQISVQEAAREFARTICKPGVIQRDTTMQYPFDEVKQMAKLGFMGMMVDPLFGGSGLDTVSYVLAMEEISKVDNSCSVIMSVNNSLVCWGIEEYGSEEQKVKYLPLLSSGEWIGSFCLS
ncbi:MAG: acyl-CoA dehydrogenase family protein, partial [Bacteroidota bacterium]